jgi:hypothetical protein
VLPKTSGLQASIAKLPVTNWAALHTRMAEDNGFYVPSANDLTGVSPIGMIAMVLKTGDIPAGGDADLVSISIVSRKSVVPTFGVLYLN